MSKRFDLDRLRDLAASGIRKVRPVTRTIEKVASLAVQVRGAVTPLAAVGLVSTAVNALEEFASPAPRAPMASDIVPCSPATISAALLRAGFVVEQLSDDGDLYVRDSLRVRVSLSSVVNTSSVAALDAVDEALDAFLPPVTMISHAAGTYHDAPAKPRQYTTEAGALIADTLKAHEPDWPRCVLLHGPPGTGKTAMTREIVDRLNIGRVVVLHPTACAGGIHAHMLVRLSPAVLVVDDIDKLKGFDLSDVEALRAVARVVILTANNGSLAEVIDGATIRPGRIDEVFEINGEQRPPDPPFNLLPPEVWTEVNLWPPAFLNELGLRLERRGWAGARLDDLRERLGRAVRSRDVIGEPTRRRDNGPAVATNAPPAPPLTRRTP